MKAVFSLRKHSYLKIIGTFLIAIALIAGVAGCEGEPVETYNLTLVVNPAGAGTATDETGTSPYPAGTVVDIKAVAELTHQAGGKLIVDNVFATPILQRPLDLGADIVTYSATKHIDGQGRCLGGAVLSNDAHFMEKQLTPFYRNTGPSLSPFNAWLLLKGLETLELRVSRQCQNALEIAEFLGDQVNVERVIYPALAIHPQHELAMDQMSGQGGTVVTFVVSGGKAEAFKTLNALKIVDIANNLGDAKSLITHPATTTHQRLSDEERAAMGISDNMIRLSVGIEDVEDLREDLAQALG